MPTDVLMPQMGESIFEGTITKWLKKPGDTVRRDEPLFEISTDKVDAEIPSPAAGVLTEIRVGEGSTVQVNAVVGVIGDGTAAAPSAPPPQSPPPKAETSAARGVANGSQACLCQFGFPAGLRQHAVEFDEDVVQHLIAAFTKIQRPPYSVEQSKCNGPALVARFHQDRVREALLRQATGPGPALKERGIGARFQIPPLRLQGGEILDVGHDDVRGTVRWAPARTFLRGPV